MSTDLATTHLHAGHPEEALAAGQLAITTAAPIASVRTRERLRTLHTATGLVADRSWPARELHERLTHFLTEQSRRPAEEQPQ